MGAIWLMTAIDSFVGRRWPSSPSTPCIPVPQAVVLFTDERDPQYIGQAMAVLERYFQIVFNGEEQLRRLCAAIAPSEYWSAGNYLVYASLRLVKRHARLRLAVKGQPLLHSVSGQDYERTRHCLPLGDDL